MEAILLDPAKKRAAAVATAEAFYNYPLFRGYFPEEKRWRRVMVPYFEFWITAALRYGLAYTTPDLAGVSLWLPPGKAHVTFWEYIAVGGARQIALMGMKPFLTQMKYDSYAEKIHGELVPEPHWYLWGLAVHPGFQNQGAGSRLMQPILEQADLHNLPCYLETHVEQNIPYYQKRGFAVARSIKPPGLDIPLYCMVRPAGAAGSRGARLPR